MLLLPLDRSYLPCEMKLHVHEEGETRNQIQTQDFDDLHREKRSSHAQAEAKGVMKLGLNARPGLVG